MSDLVVNPEDRFSRFAAHIMFVCAVFFQRNVLSLKPMYDKAKSDQPVFLLVLIIVVKFWIHERQHEKANICGFRPGLSQTRLYSC